MRLLFVSSHVDTMMAQLYLAGNCVCIERTCCVVVHCRVGVSAASVAVVGALSLASQSHETADSNCFHSHIICFSTLFERFEVVGVNRTKVKLEIVWILVRIFRRHWIYVSFGPIDLVEGNASTSMFIPSQTSLHQHNVLRPRTETSPNRRAA